MTKRVRELSDTELFNELEDNVWDIVFSNTVLNEDETGLTPIFRELKKRYPQFRSNLSEDEKDNDEDEEDDEDDEQSITTTDVE